MKRLKPLTIVLAIAAQMFLHQTPMLDGQEADEGHIFNPGISIAPKMPLPM